MSNAQSHNQYVDLPLVPFGRWVATHRPLRFHRGFQSLNAATLALMAKKLSLTAIYETVENDWVQARIAEIPGVITVAPTRAEVEELLLDALREYLLSFQEDPSPDLGSGETASLEILLTA